MTITATAVIRDLTLGTGTPYAWDVAGLGGMGTPEPKVAQTDYDGRDGSFAGPEFLGVRILTLPFVLLGTDPDDALNGLEELNIAFAPARDGVDVPLVLTLGAKVYTYAGRPRGVDVDPALWKAGTLRALCTYVATSPTPDITDVGP